MPDDLITLSGHTELVDCRCSGWAREAPATWTGHHDRCEKFNAAEEIRRLVLPLLEGIEAWAGDEDGVHWKCWAAYQSACLALGEWERLRLSNSSDDCGIAPPASADAVGRDGE